MIRVLDRLRGFSNASAMANVVGLRMLALGSNLCTGLLTAAVLGPSGRGEQAALIAAPQFLAAIATLGLHASLIYNMKADPARERRYFGCAMLLALLAGLTITVAGWAILPHWLRQYGPDTVRTGRLLLLFTPLSVVSPLLTGALEAHGKFITANSMLYVQSLLTLAALGLLWYGDLLSPAAAALAYLCPSLLALGFFARRLVKLVPPIVTLERAIVRRLLHYGLRFYGVDLLGNISVYMDQIVIVALLAKSLVGIYVVALSLSRVLTALQGAVTSVLFPTVAARAQSSVIETVALTVRITTVLSLAAALGLGVVGPYLLHLLYGERFMAAVAPFRILLAETVVANATRILYQTFNGTGRPGVVTAIEAIGVTASLGSMLLVVPRFGIDGAAACVLLASSIRLGCTLIGFTVCLRVRMPRLILTPADVMWIVGR